MASNPLFPPHGILPNSWLVLYPLYYPAIGQSTQAAVVGLYMPPLNQKGTPATH